jgi:predicted nucleotidyltransferase
MRTLVQRGMVQSVRHGPAISYRLNEDHWLVKTGLRPLFDGESNFLTAIGEAVQKVAGVPMRSVIVFGSVARGEAAAVSDIDLLCLTEKEAARAEAEQNLADKATDLRRQFGRRLSVMVLPAAEFARRYQERDQLAREIVETGWVVAGDPLGEVLR